MPKLIIAIHLLFASFESITAIEMLGEGVKEGEGNPTSPSMIYVVLQIESLCGKVNEIESLWIMAATSSSYVRPSLFLEATYASNDTQHLAAVLRLFCDFIPVLEPLYVIVTMVDANEVDEALNVDEAPKLNSNLEEDAPQSDNAPSIILSNVEKEEDDDEREDEGESEEDEDVIVVVNVEGTNTDKEQNKGDVVKKDEKKAGETKNGEELAKNFKRKEKRARPRNRNKKKDALKASGTLAVVEDKPKSSI
ncbi:hypothetical protein Tco_0623201 [Tanacetum coccineum]